jgi:hypothetical protein
MHGYLLTGLCALQLPKKVVLSMARFRLSGHYLRIEREVVTSNDKPSSIVAHRYIIEASIDVS